MIVLHIILDPTSNEPIYEQIISQVRARILQGVVISGDQVPSVREMSAQLMVNPNTVSKAYKELEREGVFVTYRGKGTFVNEGVSELLKKKEVELLKEKIKQLVDSAILIGIEREEMKSWVDECFERMGGEE
ncbi:GntR family transcriptional regulator [Bacillaceae bacterium W0354]